MGGNILNKNILAIGIIILFILSTLTPIAIGHKIANINGKLQDNIDLEEPLQYDGGTLGLTGMGPKDTPWPMKCHDNKHTGRSPYSTVHIDGTEKWRFSLYHRATNDPIIDSDGTIYFARELDHLYAINPDGTEKWNVQLGGQIIGSTAAIGEDGTIYVGAWDDCLHAIKPDGKEKWKFDTGDNIASSPAIADDGTIYFGTMGFPTEGGCNMFAVNPDGTEKWRYHTGDVITSSPAIGDDGMVYFGSQDDYFYALYPNGTLYWRFQTGDSITGEPSIADDGTVYISSYDDYLYAFYPNGTKKWKTKIHLGSNGCASIGEDGTIYVGSMEYFFAINPDGTKKWTTDIGAKMSACSPTLSSDGTIYLGAHYKDDDGGDIIAINSEDGLIKWRKKIANYGCYTTPAIASDGTIYIGSHSVSPDGGWYGYLHAFGPLDPNAPQDPTINGPTSGIAGVSYDYTFVTTDPRGEDVYYWIEWGNDRHTEWLGPYPSGYEMTYDYTYTETGSYTISCRAKNTDNLFGPWGTFSVTMPRNRLINNPMFTKFMEGFMDRFPLFARLLRIY